jgi:hypothetical protein
MTGAEDGTARGGPPPGFVGLVVPVQGPVRVRRFAFTRECLGYAPGPGDGRGWPWPVKWTDAIDGQRFAWCGERRCLADLPENPAAFAVAARLGQADLADRIGLRGNLLLAGIDADGAPVDVPAVVVRCAVRAGLLADDDGRSAVVGLSSRVLAGPRRRPGPPRIRE